MYQYLAGGSRERDRVADIGEAGDLGEDAASESRGEAKASLRHRAHDGPIKSL
jgi:hypothetical protein